MADTIGSLVDKLTICELRRWHTERAMLNPAAPVEVRHVAALRLRVIDEQREDLCGELDGHWRALVERGSTPKVYRQLKVYNDPRLRAATACRPISTRKADR
jgi:hypothetical protein